MEHNPLDGQQHFFELEILYLLTEIALQNSATLRDTIRNTVEDPYLTADSVRCLPIGEDSEGNRFFLFSLRYEDCRLYKQLRQQKGPPVNSDEAEPVLMTVTTTLEELKTFIENLRRAKHTAEKKLHRYLSGILPEFERTERHRKKVEDRAALREQAPLLKRSSRLQEQAKRKEKARGQTRVAKDVDLGDLRQDDAIGEEPANVFDLGISREERMRLRNQRRVLAEKGLRRVLTGKKRDLEYDGLTPLGASVQCPSKKRFQNVRPSRNITKLVSIIWEKFRRPMHHRKQFETHMEAAKKRRAAAIQQGKTDVLSRWRLSQRPYEGIGSIRDPRLPTQDVYRPGYVQQPSLIMNYLQQQHPIRSSYSFGRLQVPRPLQATPEGSGQQMAVNPVMQQHTLMRYPSPLRDPQATYGAQQRPPGLADSLRQHMAQQQRNRAYELPNRGVILSQRPMEQGMVGGDVRSVARAATFPPGYSQRLPEQGYVRSVHPYSPHDPQHGLPGSINGLPGYPASVRSVQPHLATNRLAPSLVQFPVSLNQSPGKVHWNAHDVPKMPYAQPYLPQNQMPYRPSHFDSNRPPVPPFQYDNGSRWHPTPQMHDNGGASGQDPNGMLSSLFLKRKRND